MGCVILIRMILWYRKSQEYSKLTEKSTRIGQRVDAEIRNVIKRLEKRKKHIRKTINKNTGKHTKRLGRKEKTNFKTLKPSLLELKIKKKTNQTKTYYAPSRSCRNGDRKKILNLNLRGPGFDPLPRKKPDLSRR